MDQWLQKLSLPVLIVVAGLAFYGYSREVSCWTPTHFTSTYDQYTNSLCSNPNAVKYKVFEEEKIPIEPRNQNSSQLKSDVIEKSNWLLKMVLFETVLVCIVYTLVGGLEAAGSYDARYPHKELHTSYAKVPLYFILQAATCLCWLIIAILSVKKNDSSEDQIFLCDFATRRLGNVQRYTVQCTEQGIKYTNAALLLNFSLALIITIIKAVHIFSTLFIGPFLRMKGARAVLLDKNVINNPSQLGPGFALTDLYFASLVSGKDGLVLEVTKPDNENEMTRLSKTD